MVQKVRLSEISAEATAALAALDTGALVRLTERLDEAVAGRVEIEPEASETVSRPQRVLQQLLVATEGSLQVLERLTNRKGIDEWAR